MSSSNLEEIFKAYDVRGEVGTQLTPKLVKNIGKVFANWLPEDGVVAVGRDMRPDSKILAKAFVDGLIEQGRNVMDIGEVTSDMIYFAVGKYSLAGGAVITASHNKGSDNGIKLYRDHVIAVGLDSGLDEIRDLVLAKKLGKESKVKGQVKRKNITSDWVEHCLKFAKDLYPFHIAIDAGNGMAGAILPEILPELPLRVEEMYFKLDGTFPNHEANPQKSENIKDLVEKIKNEGLDFGIAFDGDGDRAVFVDDLGRPVLGSDLISIVANLILHKYPHSKIVYDVRTSRATNELITKWGGKPIRTKAGRVGIGSLMREIDAPFGGETTGHLFFKENYYADSGLIAALSAIQALSETDKPLSELVDSYRFYSMAPEINFEVKDKGKVLNKLKETFADGKQDFLDGLTVNYPDYWFNVRISNTELVMRLNVEATNKKLLDQIIAKVTKLMNG